MKMMDAFRSIWRESRESFRASYYESMFGTVMGRIGVEVPKGGKVEVLVVAQPSPVLTSRGWTGEPGWIHLMQGGKKLKVWIQHYPDQELSQEAYQADQVICCHAELLPEGIRRKHISPDSIGSVMVICCRKERILVMSWNRNTLQ